MAALCCPALLPKAKGGMARRDRQTGRLPKALGQGLAYIAIPGRPNVKSSFAKFMTEAQMNALIRAMNGETGDLLLFAADKNKVVWDVLGEQGWNWQRGRWNFSKQD